MPLGLVYLLRRGPGPLPWLFLALCLLIIVVSGKRAAWITAVFELCALAAYYGLRGSLQLPRVVVPTIMAALVLIGAYLSSDWVQSRTQILVTALDEPDYQTLNMATGKRLPIWSTAIRMGRDNWLNGVGPRGFRFAYADYAAEGDEWAEPMRGGPGSRGSHAHQLILDLFAETGVIGVAGYLAMLVLLLRCWQSASAAARSRALPYGISLVGMLCPLNTHPAWYSSWSGLLLWFFLGLYLFALSDHASVGADR